MAKLPTTGPELRGLRETAGIKAVDLAHDLKMDNSALSQIEKGRRAVPSDLPARYCAAVHKLTRKRLEKVSSVLGAA